MHTFYQSGHVPQQTLGESRKVSNTIRHVFFDVCFIVFTLKRVLLVHLKEFNHLKMEFNRNSDECLDYEYDKENERNENVPENKPSGKELKKVKLDKIAVQTIVKTLDDIRLAQEKIKEKLLLKALSQRSSAHTLVHRPARSYSKSRRYSSPYSWSAKK
ncbi:hypothetical protein AVEN_128338-1 [Araneus ventricosus]|uniref:Uncharacterized protein n=1 Tax=Araneus ventricosus TaxID=182803 RepID=A0A4Y2DC66_ARAVE|nr:hypothetical protein AVEN_128338-1 [Araneus ventricosus]